MTKDKQIIYRCAFSDEQAKRNLISAAKRQGSSTEFTDFLVYKDKGWKRISYGF
jgi:hypothetical protein